MNLLCENKTNNIDTYGYAMGDEFVTLVENDDYHQLDELLAQFVNAMHGDYSHRVKNIQLSIAYGCAIYNETKDTSYKNIF